MHRGFFSKQQLACLSVGFIFLLLFATIFRYNTELMTAAALPQSAFIVLSRDNVETERTIARPAESAGGDCSLNASFFISDRSVTELVTIYFVDRQQAACDISNATLKMDKEKWLEPAFENFDKNYSSACLSSNCGESKKLDPRCPLIKGRRVLVNYASNDCCQQSQLSNCQTGLQVGGFDICLAFNEKGIDADFAAKNCKVLTAKSGAGLWLWKPYIIYRTLLAMSDDDYLFYSDSGSEFVRNVEESVMCQQARLGQDVVVFSVGLLERDYTKEDAFVLMGCTAEECRTTFQRLASFIVFRKSHVSIRFVAEWLTYAQDWRIISNEDSKMFPPLIAEQSHSQRGFVNHRNDQSILSLLAKKWKLDPSQWGDIPGDQTSEALKAQEHFQFMQNMHFIDHHRNKS